MSDREFKSQVKDLGEGSTSRCGVLFDFPMPPKFCREGRSSAHDRYVACVLGPTVAALLLLAGASAASGQDTRPAYLTDQELLVYELQIPPDPPEAELYSFFYTRSCDGSAACDCDILTDDVDLNGDGRLEDAEDSCIAIRDGDGDMTFDVVQDDNANGVADLVDPDWRGGGPGTNLVPSVVHALSQVLPVYREDWGFEEPNWAGVPREVWLYDFPQPAFRSDAVGLAHSDGSRVELDAQHLRDDASNLPRTVMAHEAWHMTQYAHAWSKSLSGDWGVEGQARMVEDRVLPDLDTDPSSPFLLSARAYLQNPTWVVGETIDEADVNQAYGLLGASYDAALWWSYLLEQAGNDHVGTSGEGMDFVKGVFDLREQLQTGGLTAVDLTLRDRIGRGFDDVFWDFTIANYAKDLDVDGLAPEALDGRDPTAVLRHREELEDPGLPVMSFGSVAREAFDATQLSAAVGGVVDAMQPSVSDPDAMSTYGAKYVEAELPDPATCPLVTWEVLNFEGEPLMHSLLVIAADTDGNFRDELVALARHRGDNFSRGVLNRPEYRRLVGIVATGGNRAGFTWEARCSDGPTVDIVEPTGTFPVAVGDPGEPGRFLVWLKVQDLPVTDSVTGLDWRRDFGVEVDQQPATILNGDEVQNQYWLLVQAPELPQRGPGSKVDLKVSLTGTNTTDMEASAIAYEVVSKDQVLVLDNSGSMINQSKLVSAQAAARLFADATQAQDQIGVVSFSNAAALEYDLTLVPDQDDAAGVRAVARQSIDGIAAANETSIGAGLFMGQAALNKAGIEGSDPWIVLLSDGIENRPPWAMDVVNNALGPTGTRVHAIALGTEADSALMRNIALVTCGQIMVDHCWQALDNDGLPLPMAIAAAPLPLPDLTNGLADIYRRAGETIANHQRLWQEESEGNQAFKVTVTDKGAKEAFLSFNWRDANRPISVAVTPPIGAIPFTYLSDGANHATFFTPELVAGDYTIQIGGSNEWIGSLSARIAQGVELHAFIDTLEEDRKVLEPVQLQVSLTGDNGPIAGASITADVYRFDGTQEVIELRDDGVAPHDDEPGDGVYGYSYDRVNGIELHNIVFDVAATGESFSRFQRLTYRPADTSRMDQDNDGLVDHWQARYDVVGGNRDPDRDGLVNRREMDLGTDPTHADTDRGGESDGSEVRHGRDPLAAGDDAIPPLADVRCDAQPEAATLRFDSRSEYSRVRVFRRIGNTGFASIGDFDASQGAVEDSGLVNKRTYRYVLQALGAGGAQGGYSAPILCQPREDPYPPAGHVVIDAGADTTSSTEVTLRFAQPVNANGLADIVQIKLSNTPDVFRQPWRPFATTLPWTIDPDPQTGWAYVYALFRDGQGNVSASVAADGIQYELQ